MKTTKTNRAVVTPVTIAGQDFEGLMFPDGSYGISLSQAATLLEIKAPKTSFASRLKRIQPEGYETTKNYVSGVSRASFALPNP